MRNSRLAVLSALAMVAAPAVMLAQSPTKWTAKTDSLPVDQGDTAHVTLELVVDPGWHIYSVTQSAGGPMPTKITLAKDQPFFLGGPIESSEPTVVFDKGFSMQVEEHEGNAKFFVPVLVDSTLKDGKYDAKIIARFVVCNATMCLPAKNEKLSVSMNVQKGGSKLRAPARAKAAKAKQEREKAKKK